MNEGEKKTHLFRLSEVPAKKNKDHVKCLQRLEKSVNTNPYVKYMLEAIKKAGCEMCIEKRVVCEPCRPGVAAAYDAPTRQVVLCENAVIGKRHVDQLLAHELVHVYDDCRAHVDWDNLQHVACSEIRAATLSGECFFAKETFMHFQFGWKKHHQKCARFRAAMSLITLKDITRKEADKVVDSVFDECFKDTVPFEHVPP